MGLWGKGGAHDPHTHPLTLYSFTILRRKLVLDQPLSLNLPNSEAGVAIYPSTKPRILALEAVFPSRLGLSWV